MFQHDLHPGFVLQHCILPPEKGEKIIFQKYNARKSYWLYIYDYIFCERDQILKEWFLRTKT